MASTNNINIYNILSMAFLEKFSPVWLLENDFSENLNFFLTN
jgi:hypothetical protein